MKRYGLILFLAFFGGNLCAQEAQQLFRHGKLDNGLTYYIRHTEMQPGRADFYLVQNVGALMEEDNQNGLAHFLEHMAFNGSENFREGIPVFMKRRGITRFNAQTGQNETVYYMNGVPTADRLLVDSCLLVLHDWSGFLLLRPQEIDKERGVISAERRTRRDLNTRLREQTDPVVYNGSKYATHNIIGNPDVIDHFTPDELRAYYRDFYRPDQQAVMVIGDVDPAEIEKEVKRLFAPIPRRVNPKPRLVYEIPDNAGPMYVKATDAELADPVMLLMKRVRQTPPASLKEMMKNNLLNMFYNRIMGKNIQAYADLKGNVAFLEASVSYNNLVRHYDALNIMVQPLPNKTKEALKEVLEEMERIHRFSLNDQELKIQIDNYLVGLEETEKYKDRLSNEVYAQIYQNNFLEGKPITSVEEDIALSREILSEMTAKDLQAWVASWYSDSKNWVFIMEGNGTGIVFPDKAEVVEMMRQVKETELAPLDFTVKAVPLMDFEVNGGKIVKEKKIKMLEGEEWTLANGCKVYYKFSDHDGVKVSLLGESPGGKSVLPAADLPSAQALTDLKMASGLYKHSPRMMDEILKGHQVMVSVDLGETFEGVNGVCDNTDAEMMFQLIYLLFEKPRFEREDFDRYVYFNRSQVKNTPRTVNDTISDAVRKLTTKESPRLWKMDEKFFDAMSYDKMLAIYKDRFQDASDFRFYLTGNLDREEARRLAAKYLGAIPSVYRKEQAVRYDLNRKGSVTETIRVHIPDDKYMVHIEYRNYLPLKPAEKLSVDVLGMVLHHRLGQAIRGAEGGAYGVNVKASASDEPENVQSVQIDFETATDKGDRMRAIVHEQIRKLVDEGVEEEEVEDALLVMKKGRTNVLANRGNAHWMEALRYYADRGQNLDDPALFEKVIGKIDAKSIQAFARKLFATSDCVDIVIRSE